MKKLCTVCGTLTSGAGSRCSKHQNPTRHDAFYSSREWTALSQRTIRAHVGQFGWVCPGDLPEHAPHPTRDLTTDHTQARSEGGAALERANLRVLCRSWNSTLGARVGNAARGMGGGVAPRADRTPEDRALPLRAPGRVSRKISVGAAPGLDHVRPWAPRLARVLR